ncbi:MAG: VCBS repeat-containing protein, partial [Bacteroidota bacterium]
MKKYIHHHNNLKTKYQRLKQKIERAIKNGRFYRYTKRKQNQLLKRLQSYYQRLVRNGQLALPVAGLIVGATHVSQAQTFTLETTTASPFIELDVNTNAPFGLVDVGIYSVPTFVDIDGDGDLDAFVGEADGNINYFENIGTPTSPNFQLQSTDGAFGLSNVSVQSIPTFVDIDSDGDLDAFVGERDGNINYFRNEGTAISSPVFSLLSTDGAFGLSDVGFNSAPTFVDIDGDGDLDAFVGEGNGNGNTNYFENINSGTATSNSPVFSLLSTDGAFGLSDIGYNSIPTFVDIDGDGDLDAFVGEQVGNINYFENTNSGA